MNPLLGLALGAFAIGTESFVVAPLLPVIAADTGTPITLTGQLMTIFAITYALGSPILTAITGTADRRPMALASLIAFALANLVAATATGFAQLAVARFLMGIAAGLYMPAASVAAVLLSTPEKRGRAVSMVTGGMAAAMALGVPLGAALGHLSGWRTSFLAVAVLALIAVLALWRWLPGRIAAPVTTLGERFRAIRRPDILALLSTTALYATGVFAVYTYIAPMLIESAGATPTQIDTLVFLFGLASMGGISLGGWAVDRFGVARTFKVALCALAAAMLLLATANQALTGTPVLIATGVSLVIWGFSGWACNPIQSLRLITHAPNLAAVTLSLNASAMQVGVALGAALGSVVLATGSARPLGWLGVVGALLGLWSLSWGRRQSRTSTPTPSACPKVREAEA